MHISLIFNSTSYTGLFETIDWPNRLPVRSCLITHFNLCTVIRNLIKQLQQEEQEQEQEQEQRRTTITCNILSGKEGKKNENRS